MKKTITTAYNGNSNLKQAGVKMEFTQEQLSEWIKCSVDPIYFIKKYVKIVHVDKGVVPFELYSFQERIINAYKDNRKVICKIGRQQGKTTTTAAYFLWLVLFHADKGVAIMANKAAVAREILSRIQFSYEQLPMWLQQGVKEWNKGSIELENNSFIITAATSANATRGFSCSLTYIDETAFIPPGIAEEFFASVFPTISSGKETKIFLSSTPKGLNHFHKFWVEALSGENGFVPIAAEWHENPDRDEVWLEDQRKNLGELKFRQEVLCDFLGSSKTLVDGKILGTLAFKKPIYEEKELRIYEQPQKDHSYICTVDTSRGQHLDYSAFVVIDVTSLPYSIVATYKDNTISTQAYPHLIYKICTKYNNAYALIEINDIGQVVADALYQDYEYEFIYFTHKDHINEGFGYPGVRTTKKVKGVGCTVVKDLVEQQQILLNDHRIIQEFGVYEQKGASYSAADETINDDLIACLVLFGWLTKQQLFQDLTDVNIRAILAQKMEAYIDENMLPVGMFSDGLEDIESTQIQFVLDSSRSSGPYDDPLDNWIVGN